MGNDTAGASRPVTSWPGRMAPVITGRVVITLSSPGSSPVGRSSWGRELWALADVPVGAEVVLQVPPGAWPATVREALGPVDEYLSRPGAWTIESSDPKAVSIWIQELRGVL